jgi:metacaspase-1
MANGVAIHIGLNWVDPKAYGSWTGKLKGCVNDAKDMNTIATSCGFASRLLLNEQATSAQVLTALGSASK